MDWWNALHERLDPVAGGGALPAYEVTATLVVAALLALGPTWEWLRLGVTLVHELGHAAVGVACGRRFTGFVVGGDGSGHAVTVGRPRGLGRVATTWAGYPMPAMVGAVLVWASGSGWAATVLGVLLVTFVLVLGWIRSGLTLLVLLAGIAGVGALWWWRSDSVQSAVLLAAGSLLLLGAWRHLYAVCRSPRGVDDHRVLADLTGVPAFLWLVSWAAVCALATWISAQGVLAVLG